MPVFVQPHKVSKKGHKAIKCQRKDIKVIKVIKVIPHRVSFYPLRGQARSFKGLDFPGHFAALSYADENLLLGAAGFGDREKLDVRRGSPQELFDMILGIPSHSFQGSFFLENLRTPRKNGGVLEERCLKRMGNQPPE